MLYSNTSIQRRIDSVQYFFPMPHHYSSSSDYEKSWQPAADHFYKSKYPSSIINRFDSNSELDLDYQLKDIDLSLEIDDKTIYISEKFRQKDYGDLLIELYSKYPHTKGWMENSAADYLAYFNPESVYILSKKDLTRWFEKENVLSRLAVEVEKFHLVNLRNSSRKKIELDLAEKNISITLIQAFNHTDSAEWHTLSIAIQWLDLENMGLSYKKYSLRT